MESSKWRRLRRTVIEAGLYLLFFAVVIVGLDMCVEPSKSSAAQDANPCQDEPYAPPTAPAMLTSTQQRVEFYGAHYWDRFNFRDRELIANTAYVEQAWSNYQALLDQLPARDVSRSIKHTLEHASVDSLTLATFIEVSEKYLYNPNSPMRNDEYFIPVLEFIIASDIVDELMKVRPVALLEMARKNRVGEVATDFSYTLAEGRSAKMHDLSADYTLLFFNDPACEDCKHVKQQLTESSLVSCLTSGAQGCGAGKRLALLSVCVESEQLWRESSYDPCFINAYDAQGAILAERLYDLKAMPTLYLLDRQKRVLLKDASLDRVLALLEQEAYKCTCK